MDTKQKVLLGATVAGTAAAGAALAFKFGGTDPKLTKDTPLPEIDAAVKTVGTTHVADGLWMGSDDTLYLTSPTDNSVNCWTGDGVQPVVTDKRLRWPDTMSEGPDGTIYVTASHIQDTNWFKPGAPASLPTALFSFPSMTVSA